MGLTPNAWLSVPHHTEEATISLSGATKSLAAIAAGEFRGRKQSPSQQLHHAQWLNPSALKSFLQKNDEAPARIPRSKQRPLCAQPSTVKGTVTDGNY